MSRFSAINTSKNINRMSMGLGFGLFFLSFIFLLNVFFPIKGECQNSKIQQKLDSSINVNARVSLLSDSHAKLTIDSIASPQISSRFIVNQDKMILVSGSPSRTWIRLDPKKIQLPKNLSQRWVLEVSLSEIDHAEFYVPDSTMTSGYKRIKGSRGEANGTGNVSFRSHSFSFDEKDYTTKPLYLCLESYGFNATSLLLWQEPLFHEEAEKDFLWFGLAYGIMLCMLVHNGFIYLTLKDKANRSYVLYISYFLIYLLFLNGHIAFIFKMEGAYLQTLELIFCGLFTAFSASFCKRFCELKKHMPFINKIAIVTQYIAVLVIILALNGLFSFANKAVTVIAILGPIILIYAAIVRYRQGFTPAKYFIIANVLLIFGTAQYVFYSVGLIDLSAYGNLYLTLGPALESVLLSFALASRISLLKKDKITLARSAEHYKKASETDALTSLFNKGYLLKQLDLELEKINNSGGVVSYLFLDIDHFKKYNDTFGHMEGDAVLKHLASIIRSELRQHDSGCRYGGEEFSVILPAANAEQALAVGERIRLAFSDTLFTPNEATQVTVTTSIGVAQYIPGESAAQLIHRADTALYSAKHQGRNLIVAAETRLQPLQSDSGQVFDFSS